ncbi:N-acetyl-gamma-glutamyl-phosphate reductase [uncultured Nisaea sp.]|uniref:N-acetyl-gamma-glutamyl-phosphate reductase n=1 Tax=uncultured Nisaea sp. TaxID=538215 RepID=UPI0030EE614D|tara:strand:- start:8191 stop:9156 length:966 start_codon:yes stop_codon:yes gene_type:complete
MAVSIFIDGEAGTTGLQIRERLAGRDDVSLISLGADERKDTEARRRALNEADLSILCLPDAASIEAVSLIENPETKVIDASTAYRVDNDWVYGFPELSSGQEEAVRHARFVSNPGCYPTGAIGLIRPLVENALLPADYPVTVNAVSGYSGGGKALIQSMEDTSAADHLSANVFAYGLNLQHKHLPEMQQYSMLEHAPIFQPSVGRYYKGMAVYVPLHLWALKEGIGAARIHECLSDHYSGHLFADVAPLDEAASLPRLDPEEQNGTNTIRFYVFANEKNGQCVLAATLDNLGKGASGAAVQNMNLMLGLEEGRGLTYKSAA